MLKFVQKAAVAVAGLTGSALALADSSAATAAIATAQTDALAVAGALVAMGVAVWGGMFLYRKFFK
ncbi:hypothetical protein HNP55_000704 [Paucibacter oligotrophus]|uniref:Virion coat protein B n=1 Tax=Roseateles oligotrophus TaxID=1769250 RepID=A0A840L7T2_9BURK|nr:hypothetical protein [Roseateles oligotrophus]MBB4842209.1 hypothetical protein [Roseateles oligotrophus]